VTVRHRGEHSTSSEDRAHLAVADYERQAAAAAAIALRRGRQRPAEAESGGAAQREFGPKA